MRNRYPRSDGEPSVTTYSLRPHHSTEVTADGEQVSRYRETLVDTCAVHVTVCRDIRFRCLDVEVPPPSTLCVCSYRQARRRCAISLVLLNGRGDGECRLSRNDARTDTAPWI